MAILAPLDPLWLPGANIGLFPLIYRPPEAYIGPWEASGRPLGGQIWPFWPPRGLPEASQRPIYRGKGLYRPPRGSQGLPEGPKWPFWLDMARLAPGGLSLVFYCYFGLPEASGRPNMAILASQEGHFGLPEWPIWPIWPIWPDWPLEAFPWCFTAILASQRPGGVKIGVFWPPRDPPQGPPLGGLWEAFLAIYGSPEAISPDLL